MKKDAKAYGQFKEFVATVVANIPDVPASIMQDWIENPKGLQGALRKALLMKRKTIDGKIWEGVSVNLGMVLKVNYMDGTERKFLLGAITSSDEIVKVINPGEVLWGERPEKEHCYIQGKRYKNVSSAEFVEMKEDVGRGWWHIVNENECERFFIETGVDSSTYRFVFRIEKDKDDIIVYGFFP